MESNDKACVIRPVQKLMLGCIGVLILLFIGCSAAYDRNSSSSSYDYYDEKYYGDEYYDDLIDIEYYGERAPTDNEQARMDYVYQEIFKYLEQFRNSVPSFMIPASGYNGYVENTYEITNKNSDGWTITYSQSASTRDTFSGRMIAVRYTNNLQLNNFINGITNEYPLNLIYAYLLLSEEIQKEKGLKAISWLIRGTDALIYIRINNSYKKRLCKLDHTASKYPFFIPLSCVERFPNEWFPVTSKEVSNLSLLANDLKRIYFSEKFGP